MEAGSSVIIFIFLIGICYIIYDSIPSKYTIRRVLSLHFYRLLLELSYGCLKNIGYS